MSDSDKEREEAKQIVGLVHSTNAAKSLNRSITGTSHHVKLMLEAERMMIAGKSTVTIVDVLSQRHKLTRNKVTVVIGDVLEVWKEDSKFVDREARVSQRRTQLERVLERAFELDDLKTATTVLDRLLKVDGVLSDTPQQHVHLHAPTSDDIRVKSMTQEEKRNRLEHLLKLREEHLQLRKSEPIDVEVEENDSSD
jgi:hypothetical protein